MITYPTIRMQKYPKLSTTVEQQIMRSIISPHIISAAAATTSIVCKSPK